MADALRQFVEENLLSVESVLKYIDTYSIYSHYLGFEPELYTKYSSPLRTGDSDPSFSIYESKYKKDVIMFKDSATGLYGGVFKFLTHLYDTDLRTVLRMVNRDFGLGLDGDTTDFKVAKKVTTTLVVKHRTKIKVTTITPSEDFNRFWNRLGIGKNVIDMYFAREVAVVHYENQDYKVTVVPKTLCISYEIQGYYKVYQPGGERKYKFRNDFPHGYVEGAKQLKFHKDFVIITKSMKECMFFRQHFDFDAVAGTSENSMISEYFMLNWLFKKYKRVYIMLDNDKAGLTAMDRYTEKYPDLIPIVFESKYAQKDPTDEFVEARKVGREEEFLTRLNQTFI